MTSRKVRGLAYITANLLRHQATVNSNGSGPIMLTPTSIASDMGIRKRRLYDIFNVCEGAGVLARTNVFLDDIGTTVNCYRWNTAPLLALASEDSVWRKHGERIFIRCAQHSASRTAASVFRPKGSESTINEASLMKSVVYLDPSTYGPGMATGKRTTVRMLTYMFISNMVAARGSGRRVSTHMTGMRKRTSHNNRRVYDVVNVLWAIRVLTRPLSMTKTKCVYRWAGPPTNAVATDGRETPLPSIQEDDSSNDDYPFGRDLEDLFGISGLLDTQPLLCPAVLTRPETKKRARKDLEYGKGMRTKNKKKTKNRRRGRRILKRSAKAFDLMNSDDDQDGFERERRSLCLVVGERERERETRTCM